MRTFVRRLSLVLVLPLALALPAHAGDPLQVVLDGTIASGSADWPSWSRLQTGRLNRNGIASSCAQPKSCEQFVLDPGRAVDVYAFKNASSSTACFTATIEPAACNLQMNGYLGRYQPQSICLDHLGDAGLSSGAPPSPVFFSANVPAGENFFLPVHVINPGETGCDYQVTMECDGCAATRETLFAADNGFAGNTFDVTPKVPIQIVRFDVNLPVPAPAASLGTGSSTVEIYLREGTSIGHETSAAGWTSLGSASVVPVGENFGTPVAIRTPLLDAGQTYGFYVDLASYDSSNSVRYTNSVPVTYENDHVAILTNNGQSSPAFSGTFNDRAWNGRITYFVSPYVFVDGFESGTPCFWNTSPTICL